MSRNALRILLVALALISILSLTQVTSHAEDAAVDVLISYYQPPDSKDISDITNLGGEVKMVYSIVPAIAASLPRDSLTELQAEPNVKLIEEDALWTDCLEGQVLPWGVDRIDAELVHPTNKGTGVKVAVLDTGIDLDHPDLNVVGNVTFVLGTVNGDDDNGHGTMVAGVVAALDNDIGVIGVAPETALYSVKVLNSNGSGAMSDILSGIEWSTNNGMQVINMSFGGIMEMPQAVIDALNNAYNAGIVLVAGAGNGGNANGEGNNIWAPARYTPVIAVGATNENNARCPTSSTGYQLEVMAPGNNIYTTAMGGGYGTLSTTSTSSPHAAGTAALIISSGVTSNLEVRSVLRSSATDLGAAGWDPQYGNGLINAYQAVSFSEPPDQTAPTTTINLAGTPGTFGWYKSDVTVTLSATDNPGGSGVAETKYSTDGGTIWNTYSSPFVLSTEGTTLLLARSWDNAGNDEGPPAFATIKLDKTPPVVTETVDPTLYVKGLKKGVMIDVSYTGTATDAVSGVYSPTSTIVIDEYGVYNQDLGGIIAWTTQVEAYCKPQDGDGRVYTFRLTAYDIAGNQAIAEATTTITR